MPKPIAVNPYPVTSSGSNSESGMKSCDTLTVSLNSTTATSTLFRDTKSEHICYLKVFIALFKLAIGAPLFDDIEPDVSSNKTQAMWGSFGNIIVPLGNSNISALCSYNCICRPPKVLC